MRALTAAVAFGLLTACTPQVPDSGVGFGTSLDNQGTTVSAIAPPLVVSEETLAPAPDSVAAAAVPGAIVAPVSPSTVSSASISTENADDIAKETAAALTAAQSNSGQAPLQASPSNPAPALVGNAGLSDENDFSSVAGRETIQSDADRIARNKAQYQVVEPTALPKRQGGTQPNVVTYALSTDHLPGTRVYSRSGINMSARAKRNCAAFASPDQAQIEFLSNGGPERDRKGLDPDGDGFACAWDPSPFRLAVKN